jgi:hypothetical protein
LLGSSRKRPGRIGSLSSGETRKLSTTEGKCSSDEDGAEAFEAVAERARVMPVPCSNVATVIGRDTTASIDNTEEDEASAGKDLDYA